MTKNQGNVFRFAPSPTGYLHVGGARTAIFNWLLARQVGGKFLLRIEDTDRDRSSAESVQQIITSLEWLGLKWDSEPLFQSQRFKRYQEVANQLIEKGMAYYCFCSRDILQQQKTSAQARKESYLYDGRCKKLTQQQVKTNLQNAVSHTVRLKVPAGHTRFMDGVHGEIGVNNNELDDFVILRSDNTPVYQLAVVVDDHDMGVTHIIRGDDHLSNTPKQILIFTALEWPIPKFSHLPLILGPDKVRLSKRHGASSVEEFREQGILPEALFNYLCLLGWAPGDDSELMTREELIERFSLERVNRANAVFDLKKLLWINSKYLTNLDGNDLIDILQQGMREDQMRVVEQNRTSFYHLIDLVKQRARTVQDIISASEYYFYDPENYEQKGIEKYFKKPESSELLSEVIKIVTCESDFSAGNLELRIRALADDKGVATAQIIHPLRVALTGGLASPGIFEIMQILGKAKVNRRIQKALEFIQNELN